MFDLSLPALVGVFTGAAAMVVAAGIVLARSGDQIAERTGLGGMFVGMLLLAGATSLPEVAKDISASLAGAPDLAVGDLFGSSMANMAILATIDLLHRGGVWPAVSLGHARLASIGIALTAIAVLGIAAPSGVRLGWVGIETVAIVGGYVAAMLWIRRSPTTAHRRGEASVEVVSPTGWGAASSHERPFRAEVARFAAGSVAVLVAAPVLALSGQGIAAATGIGETFIGTVLLAGSTSLPELVASIAAVRIGAYDLAVGNLFGSNAFNMVALLAADAAYLPGPILAAVDPAQVVAGMGAILMMALALAAVVHGERTRVSRFEPDAVLVLVVWVLLLGAVFATTTHPVAGAIP
jgi:cation:H+ antiporter